MIRLLRPARRFTLTLFIAMCGACNSYHVPPPGPVANGLTVSVADDPGLFATFGVDVTSLKLLRSDGTWKELLPAPTRVDFARYADSAEFLATADASPGETYSEAVMHLDYSHADIRIYDAGGAIVPIAAVQDGDGNPLDQADVVILHGSYLNTIKPAAGAAAGITVDFDLTASTTVADTGAGPVVRVVPAMVLDPVPTGQRPEHLRGLITAVTATGFTVDLRPAAMPMDAGATSYGSFTVDIAADPSAGTVFDIDWQPYRGGAGLSKLAALPLPAPVSVIGSFDPSNGHVLADDVLAGASVARGGGALDAVRGTVAARQGGTLTLRDAVLTPRGGSPSFVGTATVDIGAGTTVGRQLDPAPHTAADVSVGQRVRVVGVATSQSPAAVDASNGWVRMLLTTAGGGIVCRTTVDQNGVCPSSPSGVDAFTFALQRLDHAPAAFYDFTGTGTDPQHYLVQPPPPQGSLPTYTSIALGAPVVLRGYVQPFDKAAGTPDFYAPLITDATLEPAWIVVDWASPTADDVTIGGGQFLDVSLAGTGALHHLERGGDVADLTTLGITTVHLAEPVRHADHPYYLTYSPRGMAIRTGFKQLRDQMLNSSRDQRGNVVRRIAARGVYSAATQTLTAEVILMYTN